LMTARDFEKARTDVTRINGILSEKEDVVSDENASRLLRWVGFFHHVNFDMDAALEAYTRADARFQTASCLVMRAGVVLDNGDIEGAEKLINEAAERDPSNIDVLMHRSQLHVLKRELDKVEPDLRACIDRKPGHMLAYLRLATVLLHSQNLEESIKLVERAEQIRPDLSEVQQIRGEIALGQGDAEEALKRFDKAIALDPCNPTPFIDKGMTIYQTTLDKDKAIEEFSLAVKADPASATAHLRMAEIQLQFVTEFSDAEKVIGDLTGAIKLCRDKDELQELCMTRAVARAQIEAAKDLGLSSFLPSSM